MPMRVPPPGASSARLHTLDVPAQPTRRSAVLGVLLDRPRIGAGTHLARHSHDADDHDAEFGPPARNAGGVVYQGDRRLDGDVPRLRLRLVHRVLGRQRSGASREDAT